ncbi:hypothetical protein ICV35_24030 [Rhodococcus ruber]|uniref:hypothetical protein n=1 Tax=Rhodococcus ruber TaxID=1830 RepID=UPI001786C4E6|nr:hypothetical protein [Rhodococcus ruber]MBD8056721.1 hypothetical protein [Rhodococcus ruber]
MGNPVYDRSAAFDTENEMVSRYAELARVPDVILAGAVTRNADGVVTAADVVWPNGVAGVFTATSINATHKTVDAYEITYGAPPKYTFIQPTITRNGGGYATNIPPIEVN